MKLLLIILAIIPLSLSAQIDILSFSEFQEKISDNDSKLLVINFWATWCKPCVNELPHFNKTHSEYKDKGLEMWLVSLDFENQMESRVIPFLKENNLNPEVFILKQEGNSWIDEVSTSWSGAIPATLMINKEGRHFYEQEFTYEQLENTIKEHLN